MAEPPPTQDRPRPSESMLLEIRKVDQFFDTVRVGLRMAGWVGIAYCGYLSIGELAGKITLADLALRLFHSGDSEDHAAVAWFIVSTVFAGWALAERWLRLTKVAALSGRIKELESILDSHRSSSGLTASGETPPQNRLP